MYGPYWKALCATLIVIDQSGLSTAARNKQDSEILAQFDDPIQIFGDVSLSTPRSELLLTTPQMIRNNIDFVDVGESCPLSTSRF